MGSRELHHDVQVRIIELGAHDIDEIVTDNLLSHRYRGPMIHGLPQALRNDLSQIVIQSQDLLLEYRKKHGNLLMCATGERDILGKLVGYALMVETTRTSIILESLSMDLDSNSLSELKPIVASILSRIQKYWREYVPPFPILGLSHQAVETLQILIAPSASQAVNMLMEKAVAGVISPEEIYNVVEKMASVDTDGKTGWNDQVRSRFSGWICSATPADADRFREVLTGSSIPSGLECSIKMANTLSMIRTTSENEDLSEHLASVSKLLLSNEPYREKIALHEIIGYLGSEITDFHSNPDVDFDIASKFATRMSLFFRALGLSDSELSIIALTTVAEKFLGHSYQLSCSEPQIGLVVCSRYMFKKFENKNLDFERSIVLGICWGLAQSYSETARKKALEDDKVKLIFYRFTGNREFLARFSNTRLLEATLSTDLGI